MYSHYLVFSFCSGFLKGGRAGLRARGRRYPRMDIMWHYKFNREPKNAPRLRAYRLIDEVTR